MMALPTDAGKIHVDGLQVPASLLRLARLSGRGEQFHFSGALGAVVVKDKSYFKIASLLNFLIKFIVSSKDNFFL